MCGIVGRAGNLALSDEKMFKIMLLLDYFRGQDSTGVCSVTKGGYQTTLKIADDPIMLFKDNDYEHTIVGASDAIWIGHNRAATVGATSRANAHPFTVGHITGVHNGTLTKAGFVDIAAWIAEEYDTDSQTIFANIAKHGVDATIPRLEGAYALVWWDEREKTLNMIRNDQRPLYTCQSKRGETTLLSWASEWEMIAAAREMSGNTPLETHIRDDEGYAFFPLPIDVLHTWTLEQILKGDFEAETRELKGRPKPVACVTTTYVGGSANTSTVPTPSYTPSTSLTIVDQYEVFNDDIPFEDAERLILGEFNELEWEEMAGYGCACCGATIDPNDEGLLVCVNENVVLCPDCSEVSETTIVNGSSAGMNKVLELIQ